MIPVAIKHVREQKDLLLLTFEEYDDINQVEPFKGSVLSIDESQLHELEEDEAYYFELQDCEVYDETDHLIGTVCEV